jgi:hypothetical protein
MSIEPPAAEAGSTEVIILLPVQGEGILIDEQ